MKLRKEIQYYDTGEIDYICLIDENNKAQGEYLSYNKDGSTYVKGFLKDGWENRNFFDGIDFEEAKKIHDIFKKELSHFYNN
jgi:hypothetical protein